jgi:hypothetical protein
VYPDSKINTMTVLHAPYVHRIHFRYCKCSRSDYADNIQQLLRNSWWPASVTSPATCATFETLEMFRLLNVIGNMNAHDFIKTLERATNATASTGMDWLPVCFVFLGLHIPIDMGKASIHAVPAHGAPVGILETRQTSWAWAFTDWGHGNTTTRAWGGLLDVSP